MKKTSSSKTSQAATLAADFGTERPLSARCPAHRARPSAPLGTHGSDDQTSSPAYSNIFKTIYLAISFLLCPSTLFSCQPNALPAKAEFCDCLLGRAVKHSGKCRYKTVRYVTMTAWCVGQRLAIRTLCRACGASIIRSSPPFW